MLDRFKTKDSVKTDVKPSKSHKQPPKSGLAGRAQARMQSQVASRGKLLDRMKRFNRDTQAEVKKVTWPSRQQTTNLTLVVIGLSLAVGMGLGGLDALFSWLYSFAIR